MPWNTDLAYLAAIDPSGGVVDPYGLGPFSQAWPAAGGGNYGQRALVDDVSGAVSDFCRSPALPFAAGLAVGWLLARTLRR